MQDAEDFNHIVANSIDGEEWQAAVDQLASACEASRPTTQRKLRKGVHAFIQTQCQMPRLSGTVVFLGVVADADEIISRWLCPANPHLAGESVVYQLADLIVLH